MVAKEFHDQQRPIDNQDSKIINVRALINYNYLVTNFEWLYFIDFYSLILELPNVKLSIDISVYIIIYCHIF